jgi:cytochrome c oxidase assembly protein subunit 11
MINFNSRKFLSTKQNKDKKNMEETNTAVAYYVATAAVFIFGLSYASVPLYKAFCQVTGFGGTTQRSDGFKAKNIKPVQGGKVIKVYFTANVHSEMPWRFTPTQKEVHVVPGETALAFYTVRNNSDYPITGVATYNVHPPKAGLYFNKIQCFCFEEQRLGAREEIDMPVFFYLDPELASDPAMEGVSNITLSYTFFKTGQETAEELQLLAKPTPIIASAPSPVPVAAKVK